MTVVGPDIRDPHELRRADAELAARTPRLLRSIDRATRKATTCVGRVGKAAEDLSASRALRADARHDADAARSLRDRLPRTGHHADPGHHGLPWWLYLLVMVGAGIGAWLVDQGALLALELPLALTQAVAVLLVLVKLAAAHWGGHIRRRAHQCIDARLDLGRFELAVGWVCILGGFALALTVAVVRTIFGGGVWAGLLFALLGTVDFAVALVAAYAYANDAATAHDRAQRRARRASKYATHDYKILLRRIAGWRGACVAVVTTATVVIAEADRVRAGGLDNYHRNHPGEPEPAWIEPAWMTPMRVIAAGTLPDHLNVHPVLKAAGIDPDEVL